MRTPVVWCTLAICIALVHAQAVCSSSKRIPVILDHDGGVDDYVALSYLLAAENVDVIGVVVTPADSYLACAYNATQKIISFQRKTGIPVGKCNVRGKNPFPEEFRVDSCKINLFPILNENFEENDSVHSNLEGEDLIIDLVKKSPEKVTIVSIGPLTALSNALKKDETIKENIEKVVWMGGALNVPGNIVYVYAALQTFTAEWNAFWDPEAVDHVIQVLGNDKKESESHIVFVTLDVTNSFPANWDFVLPLVKQRSKYPIYDFIGTTYSLVVFREYYFWDLLAAVYATNPNFFEISKKKVYGIPNGNAEGTIREDITGKNTFAKYVGVIEKVQQENLKQHIYDTWKQPDKCL